MRLSNRVLSRLAGGLLLLAALITVAGPRWAAAAEQDQVVVYTWSGHGDSTLACINAFGFGFSSGGNWYDYSYGTVIDYDGSGQWHHRCVYTWEFA